MPFDIECYSLGMRVKEQKRDGVKSKQKKVYNNAWWVHVWDFVVLIVTCI